MKSVILMSALFAFSALANVTITNVSTTNTSSPDEIVSNGFYITKEFRTQNTSTSSVVQNGAESSFSNHFQWVMAHRVNQPEAPNFALIYLRQVNYEISFTVNDPNNLGYVLDIESAVKGIASAYRAEPRQVGMKSGLLLARVDDGDGAVLRTPITVYGGGVNIYADELVTQKEKVITNSGSWTSASYTGTRTFKVSFASRPSPAGTSVFMNYGGGETSLRYGLETQHQANGDTSRPDFEFTDYSGAGDEIPADLGHKVNIRVTALQAILDTDQDGISDEDDNCPLTPNPDQADIDGDGVGDACDNCPETANTDQADSNGNGIGDVCDYVEVSFDIFPNKLNCKSNGVVPMGIYTTEDFDATQIDIDSLEVQEVAITDAHGKLKTEDIDKDGDNDAIFHLDKTDLCYIFDSEPLKSDIEVILKGETLSGDLFKGSTTIQINKR